MDLMMAICIILFESNTASQRAIPWGFSIGQILRNACEKNDSGIIKKPLEQEFRIFKAEPLVKNWSNMLA